MADLERLHKMYSKTAIDREFHLWVESEGRAKCPSAEVSAMRHLVDIFLEKTETGNEDGLIFIPSLVELRRSNSSTKNNIDGILKDFSTERRRVVGGKAHMFVRYLMGETHAGRERKRMENRLRLREMSVGAIPDHLGGSSAFAFEQEANPRGLGYVQDRSKDE